MKLGKKGDLLLLALVLMGVILFCANLFRPKPILSLLHLDPQDVVECYYYVSFPAAGPGADFKGEQFNALLEVLEHTDVKYDSADVSSIAPTTAKVYRLCLRTERKSIGCSLLSDGFLDYEGRRYVLMEPEKVLTFFA